MSWPLAFKAVLTIGHARPEAVPRLPLEVYIHRKQFQKERSQGQKNVALQANEWVILGDFRVLAACR
jgi:hypothetical protein